MELSKEQKMELILQLRLKTGMGRLEASTHLMKNNWSVEDTINSLTIKCKRCDYIIKLWTWIPCCDGSAYICNACGYDNRISLQ